MVTSTLQSVAYVLPEITLLFTAVFILFADTRGHYKKNQLIVSISILGLFAAFFHTVLTFQYGAVETMSQTFAIDPISQFFKVILIISGLITVFFSWTSNEIKKHQHTEFQVLINLMILSTCVLVSANHLLVLFLAYEIGNHITYILIASRKNNGISKEAALKAFVHGGLTSVFFALGLIMLYGLGNSFYFNEIHNSLVGLTSEYVYLWVAFGFIFIAIAARLFSFPFHFVSIDMIHGAPTPVSAFLCVVPIVAGFNFCLRVFIQLFSVKHGADWTPVQNIPWTHFVAGIAAVTMTIGNLTAIHQNNIKRLLAYAAMGQVGFILLGLSVANSFGLVSSLFSLVAYMIMMLGSFFIVQWVINAKQNEDIRSLRGLIWQKPYEGVLLSVFLLGLAGLPPLMGFVGKFYLISVIMQKKIYWLALITLFNWIICLAYFLRIIREIFMQEDESLGLNFGTLTFSLNLLLFVMVTPVFIFGFYWDDLIEYLTHSLQVVNW